MKRRWSLVATLLIALFMIPRPARAWDWWDWAQEFSGPGPFKPNFNDSFPPNTLITLCPSGQRWDINGKEHVSIKDPQGRWKIPCYYVDFRNLVNDPQNPDENFKNEVKMVVYDFGLAFDLEERIQVGAGVGMMHFNSQDPTNPEERVTRNRFDVTLFRATAQPLQFLPIHGWKAGWKSSKWAGALKVYVKASLVPGDLNSSDFGVPTAQSSFHASNDIVWSRGFFVDFGELFRAP